MSRHNKKKKKKGNQLRDFKTRATCPACSSGKVTMLNKNRHIFKCLGQNCEHKFIFDNGVYDTLVSQAEQQDVSLKMDMHGKKEIRETKDIIIAKPSHRAPPDDPLDAFFETCKI